MRGQDTCFQQRTDFMILMTWAHQASPQRSKLDDYFRIIGQLDALKVIGNQSCENLFPGFSCSCLLLSTLFLRDFFFVYFSSSWRRAKRITKAVFWEGFRHVHYKLVVIGMKVAFLLLFLSLLLFLLYGVFLSPKSSKELYACVRLHPQAGVYIQMCASSLD